MTLFPWLALLFLLLLLAALLIAASTAASQVARRQRPFLARPAGRAVAIVALIELAAVLVWLLLLRPA